MNTRASIQERAREVVVVVVVRTRREHARVYPGACVVVVVVSLRIAADM